MAYIGISPSNGVRRKHTYTATASQTSFSGAGDEGATLSYSDSNFVDVYQNGVKLADEDYTATSGTAIVLAQGASADDIVEIIAFDVFSVADTVSKADGGTFDGDVTFTNIAGGAVFNEAGADVDFRVESDTIDHALFVDGATGSVGIGTSIPATFGKLSLAVAGTTTPTTANNVKGSSINLFAETNGDTTDSTVGIFGWQANTPGIGSGIGFSRENGGDWGSQIRFYTHPTTTSNISDITERMRIDSSGNVLVGKTASSFATAGIGLRGTVADFTRDGNPPINVNRLTSDGDMIIFHKAGSVVGTIGTAGSSIYIGGDSRGIRFVGAQWRPVDSAGNIADNNIDIGQVNARLDDIFATNATIQTSDRNDKQDIAELTDAEARVAVVAKGLMRKFRWKSAVAEKGDDARTHFGIIAQDLQDAFTAESLDASKYAMFCSDTWWEKEISVDAVEAVDEVTDEEGNVTTEAVEAKDAYTYMDSKDEATDGYTERTRLGVRYSELLAFIISAI